MPLSQREYPDLHTSYQLSIFDCKPLKFCMCLAYVAKTPQPTLPAKIPSLFMFIVLRQTTNVRLSRCFSERSTSSSLLFQADICFFLARQTRGGTKEGQACSVVVATLAEILYVKFSTRKCDTATDKLPHYSPARNNNSGFYQE